MVVGKPTQHTLTKSPDSFKLQGQPVPLVLSYRYLGVDFRCDLERSFITQDRVIQGRKVLGMLIPFLRCPTIPIHLRARVVKGTYTLTSATVGRGNRGIQFEVNRPAPKGS
jgi:hypothetical protein